MHVGRTNDKQLTEPSFCSMKPNTQQFTVHFLSYKDRRRLHYENQ